MKGREKAICFNVIPSWTHIIFHCFTHSESHEGGFGRDDKKRATTWKKESSLFVR